MATKYQKVQVNVDSKVKSEAEEIIQELGLTPTAVINSLYREIIATGKLPMSYTLTKRQLAEARIRSLASQLPHRSVETDAEIEEFFNED